MPEQSLLQRISGCNTISIIGMDKNVGKTTVLNYILKNGKGQFISSAHNEAYVEAHEGQFISSKYIGESKKGQLIPKEQMEEDKCGGRWGQFTPGLTSIGWDGENFDQVTFTEKPGICIDPGTIIATARRCLSRSDATLEVLSTTGIGTPMGEVVVVRALSCGNVELAGPSTSSGIAFICSELLKFGAYPVLVDGALNRKSPASPAVTQGVILSTGASLSPDMDKVVDETAHMVKLLTMEVLYPRDVVQTCKKVLKGARVCIIQKDGSIREIKIDTTLYSSHEILKYVDENTAYIGVKGIVTDKFIHGISACMKHDATLLVEDGTRIFAGSDTVNKFEKLGGCIKAMDSINLLCVTANPKSPYGYEFDGKIFLDKLRKSIALPVYDVVGGD